MPGKRAIMQDVSLEKRRYYLLGSVILLLLLILLFGWVRHTQTYIKATSHLPETYTELYFSNPNSLPTSTASGVVPIDFTIHNNEARTMTYTYDIDATSPSGQTALLAEDKVTLKNNQTAKVTNSSNIHSIVGRTEISVVLLGQTETIHYWVESDT